MTFNSLTLRMLNTMDQSTLELQDNHFKSFLILEAAIYGFHLPNVPSLILLVICITNMTLLNLPHTRQMEQVSQSNTEVEEQSLVSFPKMMLILEV